MRPKLRLTAEMTHLVPKLPQGPLGPVPKNVNGSLKGTKDGEKEEATNFTRFWKLVSRRE